MPFGFGPRSCIGMRFALLEAKMVLIELLKKYTIVRAPDTEVKSVDMADALKCINYGMVHSLHSGSTTDSCWCHHVSKEWHLSQSCQPKLTDS